MQESAVVDTARAQSGPWRNPPGARRLDLWLVAGMLAAAGAVLLGIVGSGVALQYFLQPAGLCLVLGGTLAVTLITTPPLALMHSLGRVAQLFVAPAADR